MSALLYFGVWEWINIALEYTASAWVKLPRWFWAVVVVNLATHPAFMLVLARFGRSLLLVLSCEIAIALFEAMLLMSMYGFRRWRLLLAVSFLMNAASYLTGVLIEL